MTVAAPSANNNNIAALKERNTELEAEIITLKEKDAEWEDMYENCEHSISQLKKQVDDKECELRVAEKEAQSFDNHATITVDWVVEYDRLSSYVRKTLFRKVKFISDSALGSIKKGSIGRAITEPFNINDDEILSWWHCYKQEAAYHGISQSRNGKITEIKNCFKSAKKYKDDNKEMLTLEELLQLREELLWDQNDGRRIINNKGLLFMVDFMYGSIIGKRQWKKDKFIVLLSSDMTTSDEAFVILVLENNWDILNAVAEAEPKYTSRNQTSNRRNDGWTNKGIIRYIELQENVNKNKKEEYCHSVEEGIMNLLYEHKDVTQE
eukprot:scaffold24040_cov56-Attheya_sp.AAC.2